MDVAMFDDKGDLQPTKGKGNMLRPEAVESLFYMWRVTGEPKYREWGWRMFQAFQKHSRTDQGAFAAVKVHPHSCPVTPLRHAFNPCSTHIPPYLSCMWFSCQSNSGRLFLPSPYTCNGQDLWLNWLEILSRRSTGRFVLTCPVWQKNVL